MDPTTMIPLFERTQWVIKQQADGLSHADSMLRIPGWDNCMNWVLGHILHYRSLTLELLGEAPAFSPDKTDMYRRDGEPVTDAEEAVPLSRLLTALDETKGRIAAALTSVPPETMDEIHNPERGQTVGDRLRFIHWHETYHVGQLEILRQLAGKNDRII